MDGMPAVDNWRRLATAVIPIQVVGRDGHLGDATHRAIYLHLKDFYLASCSQPPLASAGGRGAPSVCCLPSSWHARLYIKPALGKPATQGLVGCGLWLVGFACKGTNDKRHPAIDARRPVAGSALEPLLAPSPGGARGATTACTTWTTTGWADAGMVWLVFIFEDICVVFLSSTCRETAKKAIKS
jgi:hypothetical protein